MIEIEDKLVSDDVLEKYFSCDLNRCKGICCVLGDSGAPLEEQEIGIIEDYVEQIKPYLTPEGCKAIEKDGVFEIDSDGDFTTTLVGGAECAFAVKEENGIVLCAIEKAYRAGEIDFKKPISCHLYPIRTKKFANNTEGINYHPWDICRDAIENGKKCNIKVYQGVKEAIERKWGKEFYGHLTEVDRIITAGEIEIE